MLNPAKARQSAVPAVLAALVGGCATAPDTPDRPASEIIARNIGPLRLLAEREGVIFNLFVEARGLYRVEVVEEGRSWTITSATCEPLRGALEAYRDLPPIQPGPLTLAGRGEYPFAHQPGGTWWRWRVHGWTPDGSPLQMDLEGSQGPYPQWLSRTLLAVRSCQP